MAARDIEQDSLLLINDTDDANFSELHHNMEGHGNIISKDPGAPGSGSSSKGHNSFDDSFERSSTSLQGHHHHSSSSSSNTDHNLFIAGLPPGTDDDKLAAMFTKFGQIVSARVLVDLVTQALRNYGFVKFATHDAATRAIEEMNDVRLPPHQQVMHVTWATHREEASECDTLYVRNLPDTINRHDLANFFSRFGEVRELSLPRCAPFRGVCFVRYRSVEEAKAALNGSHNSTPFGPRALQVRYKAPSRKQNGGGGGGGGGGSSSNGGNSFSGSATSVKIQSPGSLSPVGSMHGMPLQGGIARAGSSHSLGSSGNLISPHGTGTGGAAAAAAQQQQAIPLQAMQLANGQTVLVAPQQLMSQQPPPQYVPPPPHQQQQQQQPLPPPPMYVQQQQQPAVPPTAPPPPFSHHHHHQPQPQPAPQAQQQQQQPPFPAPGDLCFFNVHDDTELVNFVTRSFGQVSMYQRMGEGYCIARLFNPQQHDFCARQLNGQALAPGRAPITVGLIGLGQ